LRPLLLEFPADPRVWDQDDQFMFGSDLVVAPVLRPAERERGVYLPEGSWYDFWTGRSHTGGGWISVPVTLRSIPIFVRAGAFVFQQPVVQHTGEMPGNALQVAVYPAARSSSTLYEDDGATLQYKNGAFARRRFSQIRTSGSAGRDQAATIEIAAAEGSYRPKARALQLSVRWDGEPGRVTARAGGDTVATLERISAAELETRQSGWSMREDGFVTVRIPDRFDGVTITIGR
jgi:alpha-glucosidase